MSDIDVVTADVNELEKQKRYAEGLAAQGFDYGLAVGSAFVESMRNAFYKHTGTALDELVDNAIEAGARKLHVALGYYGKSNAKPDGIAVIDNGHGMVPEMIRVSVLWGGTHREGNRSGFGRFGFGLPTASVNQARRFSVFSLTDGGKWNGIVVDLDEIRQGKYNDERGRVVAPAVKQINPPEWVMEHTKEHFSAGFTHGTVILWEKLDRIKWKTVTGMTKNVTAHFGITYRNYLDKIDISFDRTKIEPTDPLFVTPGFRLYDLDEDRACALPPTEFFVKSSLTGEKAKIVVRYARFPLTFFSIDKKKGAHTGNQNSRFAVNAANRGIIVCRMGRQIDVIESTPWKGFEKFGNNDRYWAAEIDFPAELDEEFTVSNNKQGVVMSDRFWDLLDQNGVQSAIRALRKGVDNDQKTKSSEQESAGEKRDSERSMEEGEKFRRKRAGADSIEREKAAKEALEQFVKRTARETKQPEAAVRSSFEKDAEEHPYRVEFERLPGAPFFRVEQMGGQKILRINMEHGFYTRLYAAPGNSRTVRAGLEVLLFSIGECELDAAGNAEKSRFYKVERAAWSEVMDSCLDVLSRFIHHTTIVEPDDEAVQAAAE